MPLEQWGKIRATILTEMIDTILTEIDLTTIKRFIYYILQQGEIYQSLWIFLYLMITVFG